MEQNLSLYRIFYTVANAGNISRAARELFISQPAISKSISKLEESLSTTLFIRNSRGVTLTEEGTLLYQHVKTAFSEIQEAEQELTRIQTLGIGHLRIGVSITLCKYILLPYLEKFITSHPHIKITIQNQASAQTLALIEQQHLDIGLVAKPRMQKNIQFYPVVEIQDAFVCSPSYLKNFYLREGKDADLFQLGNIMLLDSTNMTRHHVDAFLHENQIVIHHLLEVSTMDLLIEFAKIGIGVGCCIRECVQKELDEGILVEIPLGLSIPHRTLGFATSTQVPLNPSAQSFLSFITANSRF